MLSRTLGSHWGRWRRTEQRGEMLLRNVGEKLVEKPGKSLMISSVKRRLRADIVATDEDAPNLLIGSRSKICPPKLSTLCLSHIVVCGTGLFCALTKPHAARETKP